MDMIRVTAKTLDEAITKALIQLGTTSDNLDYTVIEKGSAGLFGFIGSKPVVIQAKRKISEEEMDLLFDQPEIVKSAKSEKPEKTKKSEKPEKSEKPVAKASAKQTAAKSDKPEKPASKQNVKPAKKSEAVEKEEAPVKEKKPVAEVKSSVNGAIYEETARKFLSQIFTAMNMEIEIKAVYDDNEKELAVDMIGVDMGILIGKRGQTLDSLQYLVSLVVNRDSEGYVRVKLDTENYRARRKDTLETLAKNIAYKVKRTRRSVSLEPMNPYERRIIHAALQNDKYVVTRSEGEDPFRHVVISLKRDNRDRDYKNNQQS